MRVFHQQDVDDLIFGTDQNQRISNR